MNKIKSLYNECIDSNLHCSITYEKITDYSIKIYKPNKETLFYTFGHTNINKIVKKGRKFLKTYNVLSDMIYLNLPLIMEPESKVIDNKQTIEPISLELTELEQRIIDINPFQRILNVFKIPIERHDKERHDKERHDKERQIPNVPKEDRIQMNEGLSSKLSDE